jgi:uncharacterized membrane protein (UPF0182 family)
VRTGIGFVQPRYRWRPQSVPTLNRIAVLVADTARSMAPSTGPIVKPPDVPVIAGDTSAAALYMAMRDALRRGDWAAFGRAFDALGRVLGKTP